MKKWLMSFLILCIAFVPVFSTSLFAMDKSDMNMEVKGDKMMKDDEMEDMEDMEDMDEDDDDDEKDE